VQDPAANVAHDTNRRSPNQRNPAGDDENSSYNSRSVEGNSVTTISRFPISILVLVLAAAAAPAMVSVMAQGQPPPDRPAVTVRGQTYTPRSILARNMGTEEDQTTPFMPHKIVGNIYYVGTRTLSSFLITTPEGHILMNSTYERNVPGIQKSVEQLGFKFADVKILLGNHAHRDHQEGDALVKQLTGAQVVAMAEDVAPLKAMKAGDKEHPVDRTLQNGETVTLGGTTLTANLTAGHTPGCTAWTTRVQENGRNYNVVFFCSLRAPGNITPPVAAAFERSFKVARSLPCDVPLGDHPGQYDMHRKFASVKPGGPNPFVDAANCTAEADVQEAMFRAALEEQKQGR
jgi:metallo-beta-lactamase class B